MEQQVDVAIIGAGSAGLYALGQVQRSTSSYVMVDGGELGTTCSRVGCMPSKALIQIAEDFHRRSIIPCSKRPFSLSCATWSTNPALGPAAIRRTWNCCKGV
ncbi:MAG: hypothetical protein BMS9Abin08_1045 [Gammaproteobacteria bacterium]|nr:MAG: hypothetical protein BMS9Abin08_1045 [Gammaproteobacteria bacterium]